MAALEEGRINTRSICLSYLSIDSRGLLHQIQLNIFSVYKKACDFYAHFSLSLVQIALEKLLSEPPPVLCDWDQDLHTEAFMCFFFFLLLFMLPARF